MSETASQTQAFALKGRLYTLTVLQLFSSDLQVIKQQIEYLMQRAPKMLRFAPIIIDLGKVSLTTQQFSAVLECVRANDLIPVAIQNANEMIRQQSVELGLANISANNVQDKQVTVEKQVTRQSKIITSPVRSGQQIYAKESDLIVLGAVSHGAELLADGNIHVYGALRGRALAGIQGNSEARIFCRSLDAELLSIAGHYVLNEVIAEHKGPKQIYLHNDKIMIDTL